MTPEPQVRQERFNRAERKGILAINYYVVRPMVCIMLKASKGKFDAANVSRIHAKANIAILEYV